MTCETHLPSRRRSSRSRGHLRFPRPHQLRLAQVVAVLVLALVLVVALVRGLRAQAQAQLAVPVWWAALELAQQLRE